MPKKEKKKRLEPGEIDEIISRLEADDLEALNLYDYSILTKDDRRKILATLLEYDYKRHWNQNYKKSHREISQNRFARQVLGIHQTLFSTYKNMSRYPEAETADVLSDRYGLVIYNLLDISPRMPNDKVLMQMYEVWDKINQERRKEILEITLNAAEEEENKGKENGGQLQFSA